MADERHTIIGEFDRILRSSKRRDFVRILGIGGMAAFLPSLVAGCSDDDSTGPGGDGAVLDFSDDFGVLNYAYALEQLEAAFYIQVMSSPYGGMTASETAVLGDIRQHEIIHRDFLKAALGARAIGALTPNFTSINFSNRASVLGAAKAFEDLGVQAYNGAGARIQSPENLLIAGKIVSVEARHAAAIRDLLAPRTASFAGDDVVDATSGLDMSKTPDVVLSAQGAAPFISTPISIRNL